MYNGEDSGPREAPKLVAGHYLQRCHPRVEGSQHRALVDNSEDPCNTSTVNKVMELLLVTGKIPVDNKKDQAKNYVHR